MDFDPSDYPKPIYDFRKLDEYPDHEKKTNLWAWEYLRRNASYQRLWDILNELPVNLNGAWEHVDFPTNSDRFAIEHGFYSDPEPELHESYLDYCNRICGYGTLQPLSEYICNKFSLKPHPIDWRSEFANECYFVEEENPPWSLTEHITFDHDMGAPLEDAINEKYRELHERFEVVGFDLGLPVPPQIARIRALLTKKQQQLIDNQIEKIIVPRFSPKYAQRQLRILDALAIGAPEPEIRQAIDLEGEENNKGYKSAETKAINLRDKDYLTCTFSSAGK